MRRIIVAISIFAFALSLSSVQAKQPATPGEVGKEWGIIGRWGSSECTMDAKRRGTIVSYEIDKHGQFIYRRDDDPNDNNLVTEAHVDDRQRLVLQIHRSQFKQVRENAVVMEPNGNIRADYNRTADGETYTIRDGRLWQMEMRSRRSTVVVQPSSGRGWAT